MELICASGTRGSSYSGSKCLNCQIANSSACALVGARVLNALIQVRARAYILLLRMMARILRPCDSDYEYCYAASLCHGAHITIANREWSLQLSGGTAKRRVMINAERM